MPLFTVVKAFKVLLTFFLKILAFAFSSLKDFAILPVHSVGVSPSILFKVAVLSRVLLFFSAKIII
jgi:hypothetical protein